MAAEIVTTGVTKAGTAFTVWTETANGDRYTWSVADELASSQLHGVLYCHGAGSGADAFHTIAPFKALREFIIDNGGLAVEAYGNGPTRTPEDGRQNWGREFAREGYRLAAQHVSARYTIADWVVIGRSMGGLVGPWLATQDPYLAPLCVGLIHLSGIYDMLAEFDDGNHFNLPGYYGTPAPAVPPARPKDEPASSSAWATWRAQLPAWRAQSATVAARAALATATAGTDPHRFPDSVWTGRNVAVIYGTADVTATPSLSSLVLDADRNDVWGPLSRLVPVPGVGHEQPGTYGSPAQQGFLQAVWGITPVPPEPGKFYRILSAYERRGRDRNHPILRLG